MLRLLTSSRFRKEFKRITKRGKDLEKFEEVVRLLRTREPLPPHYRDHPLSGDYAGQRELHIEPDWLLVYYVSDDCLNLARTGAHADLFE